jgi:hypothetical protein
MEKLLTIEQRDEKMKEIISNEISSRVEMQFNREKTIKEIMKLEDELFMPKHVPKGTEEDPDNPEYREFSQEEKDNCACQNCKYPLEWWQRMEKNTDKESKNYGKLEHVESDLRLRKYLQELEDMRVNPV